MGTAAVEAMVQDDQGCYVSGNLVSAEFPRAGDYNTALPLIGYAKKQCNRRCSPGGWCQENPWQPLDPQWRLWGDRTDNLWALGSTGNVTRWDGTNLVSAAEGYHFNAVSGKSGGAVWAVTDSGAAVRWDGAAWTAEPIGQIPLNGIWESDSGVVWAVGAQGAVYKRERGVWSSIPSGTTESLFAVWGISDESVWAVGGRGTILQWDRASSRNC